MGLMEGLKYLIGMHLDTLQEGHNGLTLRVGPGKGEFRSQTRSHQLVYVYVHSK